MSKYTHTPKHGPGSTIMVKAAVPQEPKVDEQGNLIYTAAGGEHIGVSSRAAIETATKYGKPVHFRFSGIEMVAQPSGDPEKLERDYYEKLAALAENEPPHYYVPPALQPQTAQEFRAHQVEKLINEMESLHDKITSGWSLDALHDFVDGAVKEFKVSTR